jgi:hypothetical protein
MENQECVAVKECSSCFEIKDLSLFGINKPSKDGHFNQCKECRKKTRQAIKHTNPVLYEKHLAVSRAIKVRLGKEHLRKYKYHWHVKNNEHVKNYRQKYYAENWDYCQRAGKKHWQSVKRASVAWANRTEIFRFYKEAKRLTKETGIQFHVDHIIPLGGTNVSGLHVENNLQIITSLDNNRKFNSFIEDIC